MSSGKPIVRQVAWLSLVPQLLLMGVLCLVYRACFDSTLLAVELAMITYLLLSLTLRNCIPRNYRKGIALYKAGKYVEAIEEFKRSDSFFAEHAWIDISLSHTAFFEQELIPRDGVAEHRLLLFSNWRWYHLQRILLKNAGAVSRQRTGENLLENDGIH